jgi:myo-inositol catabolism protein IolC
MNLILDIFIIFRFSVRISLTTRISGIVAVAITAILVLSVVAASMLAETEDVDAMCKNKYSREAAAAAAAASWWSSSSS